MEETADRNAVWYKFDPSKLSGTYPANYYTLHIEDNQVRWCTCGQKLASWWVYCPRCGEKV